MMELLFKNPISLWLRWWFTTIFYYAKYAGKNIHLEYMAELSGVKFENFNVVRKFARLRDVTIGRQSYIGRGSQVYHANIGRFCSIGPEVIIGPGEHPIDGVVSSHPSFYSLLNQTGKGYTDEQKFDEFPRTIVGNDVWIGARAILRTGITIGNGSVIAAGAVVTHDVPANSVVGGVPARLIRKRHDDDLYELIESLQWWNWTDDDLESHGHLFTDTKKFSEHFQQKIN